MSFERLFVAQQSGRISKDQQLLIDQAARLIEENKEAAVLLDEKISRLKALRLQRDANKSLRAYPLLTE